MVEHFLNRKAFYEIIFKVEGAHIKRLTHVSRHNEESKKKSNVVVSAVL
jgi:hypothetical protein